ncbi:MAG: hypothetical protein J7K54_04245 [Candidatus Aenigmarchaeota archaeon]|nr:hypothetical protein [Candidatus Aenigmarchaeota archaeon]
MPAEKNKNDRNPEEYKDGFCDSCYEEKPCRIYDIEYTNLPRIGIYGTPLSDAPFLCDSCVEKLFLKFSFRSSKLSQSP